jgi:peptide/nickel transport system permease protein
MSRVWEWAKFLAKRLAQLLVVLIGISIVVFIVTHAIGNPVYLIVGQTATSEVIQERIHKFGLDRPLWEQYILYIQNLLKGDWGISRYTYNPVLVDIQNRLPATLELSIFALLLSLLWSIPLGVIAAFKKGGLIDSFIQFLSRLANSVPGFWLGLVLIFAFFAKLHLLPAPLGRIDSNIAMPPRITGLIVIDSLLAGNTPALISSLRHLILPAVTLAVTVSPSILLLTRNTMEKVLESNFIRAARAFGLSSLTIVRYSLKNILGPVLTMVAMTLGYLIGGTVLIEVVFAWPGIGFYAVDAMNHSDYEPILAVVLLCALVYNLAYLISDVIAAMIDPRVRL